MIPKRIQKQMLRRPDPLGEIFAAGERLAAVIGSEAQAEVVRRMRAGETLMWFGDSGPEISGRPLWPQKRTVRAMLKNGTLKWGEYNNETQRRCGIRPLLLNVRPLAPADTQTPDANGNS